MKAKMNEEQRKQMIRLCEETSELQHTLNLLTARMDLDEFTRLLETDLISEQLRKHTELRQKIIYATNILAERE